MASRLLASSAALFRACRERALGLLYPAACVGCGGEFDAPPATLLCDLCSATVVAGYGSACPKCAMPVAKIGTGIAGCAECNDQSHRFAAAIAIGRYDSLLRNYVLRAKAGKDDALGLALGKMLAERIAERWSGEMPDALIAMPVPRSRRLFRAINFADILAEALTKELSLRRIEGVLGYVRVVKKQHNLTLAQRRRNVRGALEATNVFDLRGTRLLIVDDVLTTGATADEAARALRSAGAESVRVAVVARGVGYD